MTESTPSDMANATTLATAICGEASDQGSHAPTAIAATTPDAPRVSCSRSRSVSVTPAHSVPAGTISEPTSRAAQWVEAQFAITTEPT